MIQTGCADGSENKVQTPLAMKMNHLYLNMHSGLFELDHQPVGLCPSVCFMIIRTQIKSHLPPVIIYHSQMCTVLFAGLVLVFCLTCGQIHDIH